MSRGTRPMAWLGDIPLNEQEMERQYKRLSLSSSGKAIPFVLADRNANVAIAGFAAEQWILDVVSMCYDRETPNWLFHCVMGLLLGYSPEEIEYHDRSEHPDRHRVNPREPILEGYADTSASGTDRTCPPP